MGFTFEFDTDDIFYWWAHDLKQLPKYLLKVKWCFKPLFIALLIVQIFNVGMITLCALMGKCFAILGGCIRWLTVKTMTGNQ